MVILIRPEIGYCIGILLMDLSKTLFDRGRPASLLNLFFFFLAPFTRWKTIALGFGFCNGLTVDGCGRPIQVDSTPCGACDWIRWIGEKWKAESSFFETRKDLKESCTQWSISHSTFPLSRYLVGQDSESEVKKQCSWDFTLDPLIPTIIFSAHCLAIWKLRISYVLGATTLHLYIYNHAQKKLISSWIHH